MKKEKIIQVKPQKDYKLVVSRKKRVLKEVPQCMVDEMNFIQQLFMESEKPGTHLEMKEARRLAKWYWKKLKQYPELEEFGFSEGDVYDPMDD